ncbi:MAG TPA: hypothetical protein VEK31_02620 [Xanthobacteraceae bacterium]|nr:hypothetical protein [Xanthobacteraceae bacterium]
MAASVILLAGTLVCAAQDWPTAAGATPDIVARLVADRLHGALDRTFIA